MKIIIITADGYIENLPREDRAEVRKLVIDNARTHRWSVRVPGEHWE